MKIALAMTASRQRFAALRRLHVSVSRCAPAPKPTSTPAVNVFDTKLTEGVFLAISRRRSFNI